MKIKRRILLYKQDWLRKKDKENLEKDIEDVSKTRRKSNCSSNRKIKNIN
jgi:hypothetical protein